MTQDKFKLPRSSYEELCKIIRAYGHRRKASTLGEITELSGIGKSIISANNSFLAAVEIIEGGRKKTITEKGHQLAQALEHEVQEEIERSWQIIVEHNDFLSKMVLAVEIRKGMEISSLESHIAYSAGEPKSKQVMTGSRAVIDILRNSGLVKEENDQVVPSGLAVPTTKEKPIPFTTKAAAGKVSAPPAFNINIEVHIDAKPSELEDLGEKLKTMMEILSKSSADEAMPSGKAEQRE